MLEGRRRRRLVVVDLAPVSFLDSVGAACLLRVEEAVKAGGGTLAVAGATPPVMEVIRRSGVEEKLEHEIYPTFVDAVKLVDGWREGELRPNLEAVK